MEIALATCSNLPDWEVDDRPLVAALEERRVRVAQPAWDDPRIDWDAFDACLIRTTWDYMERQEAYAAWAEDVAAITPFFNPPGVVRWNTDKRYLQQLEAVGIAGAPTIWLPRGSRPDLAELLAARGWRQAFLKPWIGATARETLRFRADPTGLADAQAHLDRVLPREGLMLQPYLDKVETEGERSAIFFEDESGELAFSHAVVKRPVPGDYRVQDDFGASDEPVDLAEREMEIARGAVAAVHRPGLWPGDPDDRLLYARVDLLRGDDDEVFVTELELVEPSLFFRHDPEAADRLADALLRRIASSS